MRNIKSLLRLHFEGGLSRRQIATSQRIAYGTVANYLTRAAAAGITWPLPPEMRERELAALLFPTTTPNRETAFAEPDFAALQHELKRKGMTKLLAWEEYRAAHEGAGYSYSHYCHRYQHWVGLQARSMRQVHRAGEKCFVDYAGQTIPIVDRVTGELQSAQIFVAVLGASSLTYAEATLSQCEADWIGSHNRAFYYFGGTTEIVVPDNLKSGVIRAHRWVPTLNDSYQSWADHYATAIIPARVRKPKDKSRAENGVQLVSRWILARLRHHTFFHISEANAAIAELLVALNDRPFQRLPGSRRSVFESIERDTLGSLPDEPYEYLHVRKARVHVDYHVEYQRHYYSVPHALVKAEVEIRASATLISIYARGQRIASHVRSTQHAGHSTHEEHMPAAHQFMSGWSPERFESWAADIGVSTLHLVRRQLTRKRHPEQSFRSVLALLDLAKQYDRVRLENACHRALTINSPTRSSVESILKKGLDQQPIKSASDTDLQDELFLQEHENVRGAKDFE